MADEFGFVARIKNAKGLVTWSGQDANVVWAIKDYAVSKKADVPEEKGAETGEYEQMSVSGRIQEIQLEIIGHAATAGNTLANALKALELPEIGTVMTVTGAGTLPADTTGTYNLMDPGVKMTLGGYATTTITLRRYKNGSTYSAMTALT